MGLILALCYYMLVGLVRFYLLGSINPRIVRLYLLFGFACMAAVLLTARWI